MGWCALSSLTLWTKIVTCHISKQDVAAISHCSLLRLCTLRGCRMGKSRLLLLVKMLIKGMILMSPDSCIFPYTEKRYIHELEMPVFLQLRVIFDVLTTCLFGVFFLQKLLYILAPPLPLGNRPSELSESLLPRIKSSVYPPNKT